MHDTYGFLRELADSWALLALFAFFLGIWVFAWRPGSRPLHDEAGAVPFRHEDRPLADAPLPAPSLSVAARAQAPAASPAPAVRARGKAGCAEACPDCACATSAGGPAPAGGHPLSPED